MDILLSFPGQLKQHLRSIRKARGLTQTQLALALGLYQSRIADIEANPAAISVEQLFRLLTALDVQLVLRAEHVTSPAPESGQEDLALQTSREGGPQSNGPRGVW